MFKVHKIETIHWLVDNAELYESLPLHNYYEVACKPNISLKGMKGVYASPDLYSVNCVHCLEKATDDDWEVEGWKYRN